MAILFGARRKLLAFLWSNTLEKRCQIIGQNALSLLEEKNYASKEPQGIQKCYFGPLFSSRHFSDSVFLVPEKAQSSS